MKPRHIAVLAVVGWYLMTAPIINGQLATSAPLTTWEISQSFDTAKQREEERARTAEPMLEQLKDPTGRDLWFRSFTATCKCIASDDPHLKEK